MTDWNVLRKVIGGELITAGEPGYDSARKPAIARFQNCRPLAIVLAESPADVAEAIGFARDNGLRVSPRSGGHCLAGRSSAGDLVLDVSRLRSVSVDGEVATVGAGVRLGELYDALAEHGRTIPAGCGPTVGIAGLTLGGGLGILGRKYGLTCDRLRGATVVLADGRVVDCDEAHDGELFWALRGAGGGQVGVVTSLVFDTVPAPVTTAFHLVWPGESAEAVVDAWQGWAPVARDELDASVRITAGRSVVVNLFGALLGTEPEAGRLLGEFAARVGTEPVTVLCEEMPYREAKGRLSGLGAVPTEWDQERGYVVGKSEFFQQPLPRRAIAELLGGFTDGIGPAQTRELSFTPWGGAYNRVPEDATAFAHRAELFLVEPMAVVDPDAPAGERAAAAGWVTRSAATVHPWGSGRVYPNFPDPDLEDWAHAYHGTNYERLVEIKRAYDPDNFFQFPQSVGIQPKEKS